MYKRQAKKTSKTKFSFGGIAAVATVVATLVGYFVDMLSTNEALSEKMGKIWEKITEALSPVIEVVTGLFDSFINGGEGTSSILDTVVELSLIHIYRHNSRGKDDIRRRSAGDDAGFHSRDIYRKAWRWPKCRIKNISAFHGLS